MAGPGLPRPRHLVSSGARVRHLDEGAPNVRGEYVESASLRHRRSPTVPSRATKTFEAIRLGHPITQV